VHGVTTAQRDAAYALLDTAMKVATGEGCQKHPARHELEHELINRLSFSNEQ
jgi:hypothetical protein